MSTTLVIIVFSGGAVRREKEVVLFHHAFCKDKRCMEIVLPGRPDSVNIIPVEKYFTLSDAGQWDETIYKEVEQHKGFPEAEKQGKNKNSRWESLVQRVVRREISASFTSRRQFIRLMV